MRLLAISTFVVGLACATHFVEAGGAAPVGLDGYCPVCIVDGGKWVVGNPEYTADFDGRSYQFPDASARDAFQAAPEKYVPALNGDCIVCYAKGGKRAAGSVNYAAAYLGRVYLFPSETIKQEFLSDPDRYVKADLAADGNCVVCQVNAGKDVPGKAEFTAIHNGFRYLFPSDNERKAFLADPKQYVKTQVATKPVQKPAKVDSNGFVTVEGRSACAACEFRVHPMNDPDELGLAVKADDGSIYVIEGAHKSYAQIYKDRFDLVRLSVVGKPIKKEGNVTWIQPESVTRVN